MEFYQLKNKFFLCKIQPIFDLLKNKSSTQKQGIIDYAGEKVQDIIHTVSESNIPTIKIKKIKI